MLLIRVTGKNVTTASITLLIEIFKLFGVMKRFDGGDVIYLKSKFLNVFFTMHGLVDLHNHCFNSPPLTTPTMEEELNHTVLPQ
jgi:hypothetical protein